MRKLISTLFAVLIAACPAPGLAQDEDSNHAYEGPVIDVHLHAARANQNGPPGGAVCPGLAADFRYTGQIPWPQFFGRLMMETECDNPIRGPLTDEEVIEQTVAAMERHDIVGVLSASADGWQAWAGAAPDRFIRGYALNVGESEITANELAEAYDAGEFAVLAEVTNQYSGVLADDPAFAEFWAMAEERGIPVGLHLGTGPPGAPMLYPQYRIQTPLAMEAVLARHPRLRVYLMHAGYPFIDDLKAMLYFYPQLYVETGVLQIAATRADYYAFLEELVRAGFGDRIMFGSDQMNWPGLIDEGIAAINQAPFLTYEQKRAILHDNAARFFAPELADIRSPR